MLNYAILIDAGFARYKIGTARQVADAEKYAQLFQAIQAAPQLEGMRLHRIYYYDSSPLTSAHQKPLNGKPVAFGESDLAQRAKKLHEQLVRQPHVALRLGDLSFDGWVVDSRKLKKARGNTLEISSDDLKPKITQKGVDMRIGMDIAALTLKKQVQVIVLVTGDSDLIPAMKFARREGASLFLVHFGHSIKASMFEHSDLTLDIKLP